MPCVQYMCVALSGYTGVLASTVVVMLVSVGTAIGQWS